MEKNKTKNSPRFPKVLSFRLITLLWDLWDWGRVGWGWGTVADSEHNFRDDLKMGRMPRKAKKSMYPLGLTHWREAVGEASEQPHSERYSKL